MFVPLQVVSTALPESRNPEQVSVAVKAFMTQVRDYFWVGIGMELRLGGD